MRDTLKLAAHVIATVLVLPQLVSFFLRAGILGRDRALQGSMEGFAWLPGVFGVVLRRAFLARVLPQCARTATLGMGVLLSHAGARIGHRVYIGPYSVLGFVDIEDDVLMASGVQVPSGARTHAFDATDVVIREQAVSRQRVRIGRGAWIGAGAVVMADVGAHTVVGAGAVVTQPLPDNVVAAGVPARVLRAR